MNIKQLMVTFFIALLAGGEIGARVLTDKFVYSQGEKVVFTFDGKSEGKTIILKYLSKKGEPVLAEIGGEPFVWEVPSEFTPAAVGVYQKEEGQLTYSSYFRVVTPGMLTTYQIAKEEYKGLNVFMLDGGMSAEYAVQKSLANLTAGVSHTWQIGPGGGPKPVWGTPDFLQQSVQHTVDLYNEYLGKSKKLKTVIIATGVPTVPYLSAAMEAPVLPLHFLVSVNSTKEVSSILEYSSQAGVPCYATLGYDASMDDVGVAWIKLLALPDEYRKFIAPLGIPDVNCIPLSALDGDNVVEKSERTPWYEGISLLDFLETVHIDNDHNLKDFRFPIQYVLRPNLDFRGFCGKVASGIIRKGDEVMALPSGKKSHIKSIVTYDGELDYAFPPQSVTLTLEDEIDVSRGEMLVHPDNLPVMDRNFETMLVWMDEEPMDINKSFFIKQTTNISRTRIDSIKYKVDVNTMEHLSIDNGKLSKETLPMQLNQIARVVLTTAKELFFDPYRQNKATGSFILIDPITNNTSAVGMIIDRVEDKDMHVSEELPVLDLPKLGIAPEHYEAVEKAVKELERQGVAVIIKK